MHRAQLYVPALMAILLLPASAFAHAVDVSWTIRGEKVDVETFYDDDTPAYKAKVHILNAKNEVIATGITDKDGKWTFDMPAPGKYEIRVDAGAGHRAKKSLHIPGAASTIEPAKEDITPSVTSTEPTREELTRTPWLRIGIGLGIIFVACVAVIGLMQWRGATKTQ